MSCNHKIHIYYPVSLFITILRRAHAEWFITFEGFAISNKIQRPHT